MMRFVFDHVLTDQCSTAVTVERPLRVAVAEIAVKILDSEMNELSLSSFSLILSRAIHKNKKIQKQFVDRFLRLHIRNTCQGHLLEIFKKNEDSFDVKEILDSSIGRGCDFKRRN